MIKMNEKRKAENRQRQYTLLRSIKRDWKIIVGDSMAYKSYPSDLKGGSLYINSDPGSVRNELTLLGPAILFKIRELYKAKLTKVEIS